MSERAEHILFARYLDEHGYIYFHPPLEGKRSPVTGKLLKAMGMKKGAPDFFIFGKMNDEKYYRFNGIHGVAIEMKSDTGKPTKEQEEWIKILGYLGWRACIAYGHEQAVEFMEQHATPFLIEWVSR